MFNWFWNSLAQLGWFNRSSRIVFIGLDNAGKTTLLHLLRDGRVYLHPPTNHPQMEEVVVGKVRIKAHDLGGHKAARVLWKTYCGSADGVVFLVDSTDYARMDEIKTELSEILASEEMHDIPVLVLGNKVDLPTAPSEAQLKESLGLQTSGKQEKAVEGIRPVELFMCSVVKKAGYLDGFKWLFNHIKSQ